MAADLSRSCDCDCLHCCSGRRTRRRPAQKAQQQVGNELKLSISKLTDNPVQQCCPCGALLKLHTRSRTLSNRLLHFYYLS